MTGRRKPPGPSGERPTFRIPKERLPPDRKARDLLLRNYFHEWAPQVREDGDTLQVTVNGPPRSEYYVDPRIKEGFAWWSRLFASVGVRDAYTSHTRKRRVGLSLSDAWTLHTFAVDLSDSDPGRPLAILHADDHDDLMSPRLQIANSASAEPSLEDLVTGRIVDLGRPGTIAAAIMSGAVTMGSFLVPLLASRPNTTLRHLRQEPPRTGGRLVGRYWLRPHEAQDTLLKPGAPRPAVTITESQGGQDYSVTSDPTEWVSDLPDDALILVHIDCDYFNNRYDGDSDWPEKERILDPDARQVGDAVNRLVNSLAAVKGKVGSAHIATSPGFFPAELWEPTVISLIDGLAPLLRTKELGEPVSTEKSEPATCLVKGRGGAKTGGGRGGSFWWVFADGTRAGKVWINVVETAGLGSHASLSIELNKKSIGRGIGTLAYGFAAERSGHDAVWLHMSKGNLASRRAAEKAGYVTVEIPGERQLVMRWNRPA